MDRSEDQPALELLVAAGDEGQRLDQYLAEPLGSRTQAARAITEGRVTVNGRPASKRTLVAADDAVAVQAEPVTLSPASGAGDSGVHDRLRGLGPARRRQAGRRGRAPGTRAIRREPWRRALADRAAGGRGSRASRGSCTGSIRDTSGLLVVAKSTEVHRLLKAMIGTRELHREYLALVEGIPAGADRHDRRADWGAIGATGC